MENFLLSKSDYPNFEHSNHIGYLHINLAAMLHGFFFKCLDFNFMPCPEIRDLDTNITTHDTTAYKKNQSKKWNDSLNKKQCPRISKIQTTDKNKHISSEIKVHHLEKFIAARSHHRQKFIAGSSSTGEALQLKEFIARRSQKWHRL